VVAFSRDGKPRKDDMKKNIERDLDRRAVLERTLAAGLTGALFGGLGFADLDAAAAQAGTTTPAGLDLKPGVRRIITGHDRITGGAFPSLYKATGDQPLGPAPGGEPQKVMPTDAPQLEPSLGGSSFHFVTLPPTPRGAKPGWHRTMTLDYNILLGGELVLMVDEGETTLHPGDVVIQRNTLHAWRNDTQSPVYWVAVLVPINRQV
jgi:quercetin dioxygenase-like cupin family protein